MDGIKVTRLSGISSNTEYKRIDGLGNIPRYQNQYAVLPGAEFAGLGCNCMQSLSGTCNETQAASQLLKEFEQRVKNHLINTYNYIVRNRANCGVKNPDQVAAAYKKIIDNWAEPTARELAMTEAERLIQNDDQIAKDFASKIAVKNKMHSAVLVKLRSGAIPSMSARRRATVINGLGSVGEVDYEIMPEAIGTTLGSVIANYSELGLAGSQDSDITVALGATLIPYNEVDYLGDDGNDNVYVLQGIDGLGKKLQIKIKPKNAINKVKKGIKAVSNTTKKVAQKAATGAKEGAKKALAKTKEIAKKAGKAIVKYNPLFVTGRSGFLLAAKLNIKQLASKLMYGYATLEQAKKAGFTEADWNRSKDGVKRAEEIFVKKAGGSANALRKAVLSSKVAKKAGLGDPATAGAIATAMPLILAIIAALRDVKVAQAGGAPGGEETSPPTGEDQVYLPPTGNTPVNPNGPEGSATKQEIDRSSENRYQNVPDDNNTSYSNPGNSKVYADTEGDIPFDPNAMNPNNAATNNEPTGTKNASGLLIGLLAIGAIGFGVSMSNEGSKEKGLKGVHNSQKEEVKLSKFTID